MPTFEQIAPGTRLRGLDPGSVAEVVQVAHPMIARPQKNS
jgi:hypothetical protein